VRNGLIRNGLLEATTQKSAKGAEKKGLAGKGHREGSEGECRAECGEIIGNGSTGCTESQVHIEVARQLLIFSGLRGACEVLGTVEMSETTHNLHGLIGPIGQNAPDERSGRNGRLTSGRLLARNVGRRVRVRTGALAGLEGMLVRRKNGTRFVISLDLIMRSVAVEVDAHDLEPVCDRSRAQKVLIVA
jgi:hypothetical protein